MNEFVDLKGEYENLKPLYDDLVDEVEFALKRTLEGSGLKVVGVHGRVKTLESFLEKVERKQYSDPFSEMSDLAGVRVVCRFTSDLDVVERLIRQLFKVFESINKTALLGVDHMGYSGSHYVIELGNRHKGSRYDGLSGLKCEIQVRTILQDAWAQINHSLVYKSEASIPEKERRELNNVSALLEIAQSIFDRSRETREQYAAEVANKQRRPSEFMLQPIDRETVAAYTKSKYPDLPINENIQEMFLAQIDRTQYRTIKELDEAVLAAQGAVAAYQREAPMLFKSGTDYLTKSLGFVDSKFRATHGFAQQTRQAFLKYEHLVERRV